MNHAHRLSTQALLFCSLALLSAASYAVCPGSSTTFMPIKSIVMQGTGSTVTSYIEIDASSGAAADPCGCRTASNSLYLIRSEAPVTDSQKMLVALAMEAKALNKRIWYYGLSCNGGANSGYVDYIQLLMEP